ncbi:MAG: hypothetical protein HFJ91_10520 [Muribaculaceae bacterium]|nr:hypothetical protein [Muribaculaceae bacterium]
MIHSLLPFLAILGLTGPDRHYYDAPVSMSGSVVCIPLQTSAPGRLKAEARMMMRGSGRSDSWSMSLIPVAGTDTLSVSLYNLTTGYGDDIVDRVYTGMTVTCGGHILMTGEAEGFSPEKDAYNTISLELASDGRTLTLSGGARTLGRVGEITLPQAIDVGEVSVSAVGRGVLSMFCVESETDPQVALSTDLDLGEVRRIISDSSAADPAVGFWNYFDRNNDPVYARPGGRYRLAVIPSGEVAGAFDILYIGGAEILADRWNGAGHRLKGRLIPAEFAGHYDLEWIDSEFRPISRDIHATVDASGALLTLSFPSLHTVMRFAKEQIVD